MPKRQFGSTGVEVSVLGFGAMHLGVTDIDDASAGRMLNEVLDLGINLIDTARSYGRSEEQIGKYISHRRDEFILSTKVGYDIQWHPDWTYESVRNGIDEALVKMKTDHLDIVHLHSCSLEILQQGDVIRALEDQKMAGKVRFIAYSGENEALKFAVSGGRFDSIQASVNICDQRIIDDPLPIIADRGMGMIAKRPVANKTWRHNSPPVGHGSAAYWPRFRKMKIFNQGMDWAEIAIRFAAYTDGVSSIIAGTASMEHFMENFHSVERGALPPEMIQNIRSEFKKNDDNWIGII